MRYGIPLVALLFLVVGPTAPGVAGEEAKSDRVHELELKLRFAEERLALHKTRSAHLMQMVKEVQAALTSAMEETSIACQALKRQIEALQDNLVQEQQRHINDVMHLQAELARANEAAESNRLRTVQSLQELAVVKEENSRLREKIKLLEAELAQLRRR